MKRKYIPWLEEEIDFIRQHQDITREECAKLINEKFGTNRTLNSVQTICYKKGLKSEIIKTWPQKHIDFILAHYKEMIKKDLLVELNKEFNTNYSYEALKGLYARLELKSGIVSQFQKGQISPTKGMKMTEATREKIKHTWFKKGHKPHNTVQVGTEVVSCNNSKLHPEKYVLIKIAEPNKWALKHRLVWEKVNGPIPKDCCLIFKDGNTLNCELDNLQLITRAELLMLNRFYADYPLDVKDICIDLVRIKQKLSKITK